LNKGGIEGVYSGQDETGECSGQKYYAHRTGGFDLRQEGQAESLCGNIANRSVTVKTQGQQGFDFSGAFVDAVY